MHRPPFLLSITLTYTVSTVAGGGKGASYITFMEKTIYGKKRKDWGLKWEKDERRGQILSPVKKKKRKKRKVSEFLVKFSIKRSVFRCRRLNNFSSPLPPPTWFSLQPFRFTLLPLSIPLFLPSETGKTEAALYISFKTTTLIKK